MICMEVLPLGHPDEPVCGTTNDDQTKCFISGRPAVLHAEHAIHQSIAQLWLVHTDQKGFRSRRGQQHRSSRMSSVNGSNNERNTVYLIISP